jgi:anti-sigma regulatory factor (Ser/Thr protein kinase)
MRAGSIALDLPMSPVAPGLARQAVEMLRLEPDAREKIRLLASELVTNALVHSGAAASGLIRISAERSGDMLRLSVTDGGTGRGQVTPRERPGIDGGFGLLLVDELAVRWGVEHGRRTTVWCEVAVCQCAPVSD